MPLNTPYYLGFRNTAASLLKAVVGIDESSKMMLRFYATSSDNHVEGWVPAFFYFCRKKLL